MKLSARIGCFLAVALLPSLGFAQQRKQSEEAFVKDKPAIGDMLPDLTVYDSNGREVATSSLRGHYTVLTFGCLT